MARSERLMWQIKDMAEGGRLGETPSQPDARA